MSLGLFSGDEEHLEWFNRGILTIALFAQGMTCFLFQAALRGWVRAVCSLCLHPLSTVLRFTEYHESGLEMNYPHVQAGELPH